MKVFISQPMRGLSKEAILQNRETAIDLVKAQYGSDIEIIDTYFKDFNGNRLEFLGKSILDGLAKADIALFIGEWEKFDGCRCEHFIATQYGLPCAYSG